MTEGMSARKSDLLRSIPSVAAVLEEEEVREWLAALPRSSIVDAIQRTLQEAREAILSGALDEPVDMSDLLARAETELVERSMPSLRRVINATGIVLHTGLGRAPLCDAAIEAIVDGAHGYCNLEYDLAQGRRGRRSTHIHDLLVSLTGAESAVVVNNNAAATLLILQTFARDREVIVSRGELVEIGGSFRLPDIMRASGALLREVGTTNRTRIDDYERAVNDRTAMMMRVHTSNYRIVGFSESASIRSIARLAHRFGLLAVDDLGSGALLDLNEHGLGGEPHVAASLTAGADLACFSADKLLGGPQAGVIVGKRELIRRIEENPLTRACRVGKLTLLALEATLRRYRDAPDALENVPVLTMLRRTTDELAEAAKELVERLVAALPEERFLICSDVTFAGGGAMPTREFETVVVQWRPDAMSTDTAVARLRQSDPPVVARIHDDAICFDLRTVRPDEFEALVESVSSVVIPDGCDDDGDAR